MKKLLSLLVLLTSYYTSSACSCGPPEYDFYKNVNKEYQIGFAVVQKFDYGFEYHGLKGHTLHLTLIDTLGEFDSEIGNTIVVTGQDGLNCGELMNHFQMGDTLILALLKGFYYRFMKDSFYLDGCGTHYHYFKSEGSYVMTIEKIKQKIKDIITDVHNPTHNEDLLIYPNPTIHGFYIRYKHEKIDRIEIFDGLGRRVQLIFNPDPLNGFYDISHYNPGMYYVLIYSSGGRQQYRITKI